MSLTLSHPSSRYVKRCTTCRKVRGNSQFSAASPTVCRFCRAAKEQERRDAKKIASRLSDLRAEHQELLAASKAITRQLKRVREELRVAEADQGDPAQLALAQI